MSKEGKTQSAKAVSVYFSPIAKKILDQYVSSSGYGSVSRTVEEIILNYHNVYNSVLAAIITSDGSVTSDPAKMQMLLTLIIQNLRLQNGSLFEKQAHQILTRKTGVNQ